LRARVKAASDRSLPSLRPDEETLELCHVRPFERPKADAAEHSFAVDGQEKSATRRRTGGGQGGEFSSEALEAQVEVEADRVLLKQRTSRFNLEGAGCMYDPSRVQLSAVWLNARRMRGRG